MPNQDIWKWAGSGGAKLRGRKQSPEHVAKRAASLRATLGKTRRVCVECSKKFKPTAAAQRYCSGKCWNVAHRRTKTRKPKLSVPLVTYEQLSEHQGRACAICGKPEKSNGRKERLAVDHHHGSGRIRGLLCHRCNTALGLFQDRAELLSRAAAYLTAPPFDLQPPDPHLIE